MRTLSSRQTWWIKYFTPAAMGLWMVGEGMWFGRHHQPRVVWAFGGLLLALLLYCIAAVRFPSLAAWLGLSLKRVRMDDQALYVSNYLQEIRIPLSDVQHVSEVLGLRHWNRVTITVRCDTPFGRKIDFMPASSRHGRRDPVVGELNALIRQ